MLPQTWIRVRTVPDVGQLISSNELGGEPHLQGHPGVRYAPVHRWPWQRPWKLVAIALPERIAQGGWRRDLETCSRITLDIYDDRHHFDPPHRIEPARVAKALLNLWGRAESRQDGH